VFEIGGGEVHIFPGNYEDYLWRKSGKPLELPVEPVEMPAVKPGPEKAARRVNPMKVQKLKERCGSIEGDIARAEGEIKTLEAELNDFKSAEESLRIVRLLDEHRAKLDQLMAEWEELTASIESA
jgi:ATP-binding cassette subfamily F protein 3